MKFRILTLLSPWQVEDYAARKKMDIDTAERWLAPILGYDR